MSQQDIKAQDIKATTGEMNEISKKFHGQQSGERVLYEIHPHKISEMVEIGKLGLMSVLLFIVLVASSFQFPMMLFFAFSLPVAVFLVGAWVVKGIHHKTVAYITDRRVVRFAATTPFHAGIRTLNFDDIVKVKTMGGGFFEDMVNTGTIVFAARTSMVKTGMGAGENLVDDDLEIHHVYYHKDLANYMDKVLYLFKHEPSELKTIREFVAKPRGKRY